LHEQRNPRLVLHNEVEHDLVKVRTMLAAVTPGDMNHLGLRLLSTVVAPINMEAGALEMHKGRRQPEALRRGGRDKTVAFRDAIVVQQVQGTSQGVIVEMLGLDPGGDKARRRFILKKPRYEVELLVDKAKPIEDHGFDGVTDGDNTGLRHMLYRPVKHVANAQFIKHPGHEPEMIQDLTPISSMHTRLLS
jgi:hypothetical protein